MPYQVQRSHSMGAERHAFRLGPRISSVQADVFEGEHHVELPLAYREFLVVLGGSGAGSFYGLLPLEECRLFTMDRQPPDGSPRGFHHVNHPNALQGDLFLHIIEMGCTDLCLIGVTGPLTGRMLTGNADGFWPPNVSSARDFLSWYERWLDHMRDGKDNGALGLTSPATVASAPWAPGPEPGTLCGRKPQSIEATELESHIPTGPLPHETRRSREKVRPPDI
ncbi:SMI1/KNR4 family protein [Streptomyces sp. NPDC001435]|uniref:SMI1/KNR4 family protein n=1 Tax=unclassified Streptomyces TaxID=2593676 RepID=UPI003675F111